MEVDGRPQLFLPSCPDAPPRGINETVRFFERQNGLTDNEKALLPLPLRVRAVLEESAACDRCCRTWKCIFHEETLTDGPSFCEIAKSQYPKPGGPPRREEQRRVTVSPGSIRLVVSQLVKIALIPPTACPGNADGSCLRHVHQRYVNKPLQEWPRSPVITGELFAGNDANSQRHDAAWNANGFPHLEVLPNQEIRRKIAHDSGFGSSWANYLAWRYVWIEYWVRKTTRHPDFELHRMWGHLEADADLLRLGLITEAEFEDMYCFDPETAEALWRLPVDWKPWAIQLLETFAGLRRDIDKKHFNPIKSAILRTKTAILGQKRDAETETMTDAPRLVSSRGKISDINTKFASVQQGMTNAGIVSYNGSDWANLAHLHLRSVAPDDHDDEQVGGADTPASRERARGAMLELFDLPQIRHTALLAARRVLSVVIL